MSATNRSHEKYMRSLMKRPPVRLSLKQRKVVEESIRETCKTNGFSGPPMLAPITCILWLQLTVDQMRRERYSRQAQLRAMRRNGCWKSKRSPWADRGSRGKVY